MLIEAVEATTRRESESFCGAQEVHTFGHQATITLMANNQRFEVKIEITAVQTPSDITTHYGLGMFPVTPTSGGFEGMELEDTDVRMIGAAELKDEEDTAA